VKASTLLTLVGLATSAISCLSACSQRKISERQAKNAADQYLSKKYTVENVHNLDVNIIEGHDNWTVTYTAKREGLGGPISVVVNEQTGEIEREFGNQ
jgi:hypothetical protein